MKLELPFKANIIVAPPAEKNDNSEVLFLQMFGNLGLSLPWELCSMLWLKNVPTVATLSKTASCPAHWLSVVLLTGAFCAFKANAKPLK